MFRSRVTLAALLACTASQAAQAVVVPSTTLESNPETIQERGDISMNKEFRISQLLSADRIVFFEPGTPKPQILSQLVSTMKLADPKGALAAIAAREAVGSTLVAPGLIVPHARIAGIDTIQAAVGFVKGQAPGDSQQPRIWLLFLSPIDNMRDHLALLAGVSALFQEEKLVQALPDLPQADDVLARIKSAEEGY